MTIASTASEIQYDGDGSSTVFAVPFPFDTSADLKVVLTSSAGVPAVLTTGFSVSGGGGSTGSVTMTTAPASGEKLLIIDDPERTQPVDYVANDAFPAETHERALDRCTRLLKRLYQLTQNSIRYADGDPARGTNAQMPTVASRRGLWARWADSSTAPLEPAELLASGTALSQSIIGGLYRPQTTAESAAGVTPTNYFYDVGDVRRYGAVGDNSTDCTAAFQAAIDVASQGTGAFVFVPQGTFRVTDTLEIAAGKNPSIQGSGKYASVIYAIGFTSDKPILHYQGTSGSPINGVYLRDVILWSNNNLARGITAAYLTFSDIDGVYFYELANGFVGTVSYTLNFRNMGAFGVTGDCYRLGDDCNNIHFDKCRMVGTNGVLVTGYAHALTFTACDIEGIINTTGAGLNFAPSTGKVVQGITIDSCYWENVRSYALAFAGADANSVKGVSARGNYIVGGYAVHFGSVSGAGATNAVYLTNVTGFEFESNYFEDWETNAFNVTGTVTNGKVARSTAASCPNLSSTSDAFPTSVETVNNFKGRRVEYGTAAPGSGTYTVGSLVWRSDGAAGTNLGWYCTVAGTPGTWVPFGAIRGGNTYSATNVTTDRAYDANATSTDELADVLGTLIADLKTAGVLS
jgi:hypothetical protein